MPHDHSHSHDHDHDHDHAGHSHAPAVSPANERVVLTGFLLTTGFMFAEIIGGLLSGSLALIADAGHMLTDAAALALAWAAFRLGRKPPDARKTFGYMRLEVLAGFVNALTLLVLVAWIVWQAVMRLFNPQPVLSGPMFVVALLGLLVNLLVFRMLSRGDRDHVNIRGALLHVLGDLLGSVAALAAAIIIYLTGWTPIDPLLSVLLSALILRSGWALLKNSLHILMEGAPVHIDIAAMQTDLPQQVTGLTGISHVHVWSITSGKVAATLEARIAPDQSPARVLADLKHTLSDTYGIAHSTVELHYADNPACPLEAQQPDA